MKKICLFALALLSLLAAEAQRETGESAIYNAHDLFAEKFQPPAGNIYRSAGGVPGPGYWQNSASYLIRARFNEQDTSVSGEVTITYTNNSPDALPYLWLQLDQNIFKPQSRSVLSTPYPGDYFGVLNKPEGGYTLSHAEVSYAGSSYVVDPVVSDTRMQLRLKSPLKPKGDQIRLKISFRFPIPADGAGRFGRLYTQQGVVYQVAQWYPRMCVYDDLEGWNTLPYMGLGEFYCEYGDYDYYITAPAGMLIFGSGDLQNPAEVLTPTEIKRLKEAAASDLTVPIIGPGEAGKPSTRPHASGDLTWHFHLKNARDVAWAAARSVVWDAARINLPSGRKALAMSMYPVESAGDSAWSRSTEYLKASIEIYSENFFEYPWNSAVSSGGITGGMEYPGMIFNDAREKRARLWFLIAHEIGHNWFPMIVGSNERKYMWQDEGFNTYINYIATDLFNKGEYVNDPAYFDKNFFASRDYKAFMHYKDPLMVMSDAMDPEQHFQYYGKTAYGLHLLRTVVLGADRFDYAFRQYIHAWAFKHPSPYDFFHCINSAAGENLNWFWKEWFFTTWKLDQAVTGVTYADDLPGKGALIHLENKGRMIMPVILKITLEDGRIETVQLPTEVWARGASWIYRYRTDGKVKKVELDPEGVLPDTNRANNGWQAPE